MGDSSDVGKSETIVTQRKTASLDNADPTGQSETIVTQRKTASVDSADQTGDDGGRAAESARLRSGGERASRRRRERRERERRAALSWPMLLGSLLSVAVSALMAFLLLRPAPPPAHLDPAEIASVASASVVAQTAAVNTLVRHLRRAQTTAARRTDFLALGPVGTGKTLLTQVLTSGLHSVTCRRLVGEVEIRRERAALDRLAGELASAAPSGGWLLLALDDIGSHLAESVYLLEAVAAAAERRDVRLITLVTATTSDPAGETGAEATREAFARHSHLLQFRPLRRSGVVACLLKYAHSRGLPLAEETAENLASAVKYEGEYAVNGCKPAIYHLRAALKLDSDLQETNA